MKMFSRKKTEISARNMYEFWNFGLEIWKIYVKTVSFEEIFVENPFHNNALGSSNEFLKWFLCRDDLDFLEEHELEVCSSH